MTTLHTTALVIGAGPAGAAAAHLLAGRGIDTVLVDQAVFPRDKTCGDALVPDTFTVLREMGLYERVAREARLLRGVRIYGPSGRSVAVRGACGCIVRRQFDEVIRRGAEEAGARFMAPFRALEPIGCNPIRGAVLEDAMTRARVHVSAAITVLATGAGIDGLNRFAVLQRREPSAVAARAYFTAPAGLDAAYDELCISYDRSIVPGYGWVFPGPQRTFNVGVGCFADGNGGTRRPSLTELWSRFIDRFEPATRIVRGGRQVSAFRGAPIRTAIAGTKLGVPGLLVAGEAAGTTYSFSGEGIGKAIESGRLAAALVTDALRAGGVRALAGVERRYADALRGRFGARFEAYEIAQRWLRSPWFANFLVWRAQRSQFVQAELEALFNETGDPRALFSARGMVRSFVC